jgi:predicted transcriptional regulator
MHDPQRDPFFEGLWADVQEGIDAANAGDLVDGEEFFAELLGEPLPVVES